MMTPIWKLATDDTRIELTIQDQQPCIQALYTPMGNNFAQRPTLVRLPRQYYLDQERISPQWIFVEGRQVNPEGGQGIELLFRDASGSLEARSCWQAFPGPGAVTHQLYLTNTSDKPCILYQPESLDIRLGVDDPMEVFFVHKDRAAARILSYMRSGYGTYLEPLRDRYAMDIWTKPDDDDTGFIPLMMLHAAGQYGVYIGWVWNHGRIAVRGIEDESLYCDIKAGLFNDFCTTIAAGECFEVPMAFIGAYSGDIDDASNRLRKWLFVHMMPEVNRTNENLPYVNWNAFYNTAIQKGSWVCQEEKYYPMMDSIAQVGMEEVTIDVGWWENYGDWRSSSIYWPHGMRAAAQYAHDRNMEFALYFTFTNKEAEDERALTSAGPNAHEEWFMENLKADFGVDACRDFIQDQLEKRFDEYLVDSLRTDYDPIITRKAYANPHRGVNDGAYWSEKGYLEVLDYFYRTKPGFRYQNCSGGGAMKGYAVMKRSATVQVSDTFDALNIRRAVWDSAYCFPMMQILSLFGDVTSGGKIGHASYRIRTFLMAAPAAHIELPSEMTPDEQALMARLIQGYKEHIRPLVRYADVYHNMPRPDGIQWDGLEYYDPKTGKGVTMIFKPDSSADTQTIRWKGLSPDAQYRVHFFDQTNPSQHLSGQALLDGIDVTLPDRFVGEWMFVEMI